MSAARQVFQKVVNQVCLKHGASKSNFFRARATMLDSTRTTCPPLSLNHRGMHISVIRHKSASYEPDGKTTVTIMNDEEGAPLMVDSYTQDGFKLNNGIQVIGPMILFSRTVLGWDVGGVQDITPSSLAMFSVLEPKPDVLVIGIGDQGAKIPLETVQFLKKKRINMEILSTDHACTTFNFLSVEGRCAAAVMIPPTKIAWTGMDLANTKLKRKKLLEDDDDDYDPKQENTKPAK